MTALSKYTPETLTLGRSVQGRDIMAHVRGGKVGGRGSTLFIGGLHGDEVATIWLLEEHLDRYRDWRHPTAVLPLANPDGYERRSRYNARHVDLNRNCDHHWRPTGAEPPGPAPWSEPESCALRDFILSWRPEKIVSLHWALAEIDADGTQSGPLARAMWSALEEEERRPYRLRMTEADESAHPSSPVEVEFPGSFGQWCGYGLRYEDGSQPAMVTLELPYDPKLPRPEILPADHLLTLAERWSRDDEGYMRAARPAVEKMLMAACDFLE